MKLKSTCVLLLLAVTGLIYTGCKKSVSNPSDTVTPKTVSSQIALNLTATLFGSQGAFDVSGGLSAPSTFAVHTKGKIVNDLNNPGCGLLIDTTLSYSYTQNDTTESISGGIKFSFSCINNVVAGYSANENLTVQLTSPQLTATEKIAEDFNLLSLNPQNQDSEFSITGSLSFGSNITYKSGTGKNGAATFSYNLTSLIINPDEDSDIVSGSATFTTTGTGANGVWNYSGTIVFKGNHLAVVTINGIAYNVNLQTGIVS